MLTLDWLKEEKLVKVRSMLKFQKLDQFLNLTGNTYPDLVKVFLTNMWYDDECVYSQVKGINFVINEDDEDDEVDEADMEHDQAGMATETPTAVAGQDYFAGFEQTMFNQLNNMQDQHRVHHEYYQTHFQLIETQVDNIQSKIGTLFFHQTSRPCIA